MEVSQKFTRYADWVADKSPLYATLAEAAASDRFLCDLAAEAPPGQPEPELLLAAVHFLLLEDPTHPLARFYPSCGGETSSEHPVPEFREFCVTNEDALRSIIATRRCQTNEVGRSAVLLPSFEYVARSANSRTLAQIEIGASAGLNLNWDRYRYEFSTAPPVGPPTAPVTITTDVRGETQPPLPDTFPTVVHRRSIDLNTVDVEDEADGRWLHALIHPNQEHRHDQLKGALEVARENPPPLIEGDALNKLPEQLAEAPDDATLTVFSTHVLYQLEDDTVRALRSLLQSHSSEQPIYWLTVDPNKDLGTPTYRVVVFDDETVTESQLAQFESYGTWLRWLAER